MTFFLKKLTAFSIIFLLIIFLILFAISNLNTFQTSDRYYANDFNDAFESLNYEVLVLGNSKAAAAIDKNIIEEALNLRTVNLGYASANISISKLTLESYLNKCINKPRLILLEVSWFTFNNNRTNFQPVAGDLFLNDYKILKHFVNYYPKSNEALKASIVERLKSIVSKNNKKLSYDKRFIESDPNRKSYTFDILEFEKVFPDHKAGIDFLLLADFNEIINLCNSEGIQLVLFTAPEDEQYTKEQLDAVAVNSVFVNTATKNKNVHYLNYTFGSSLWKKEYENWLYNSHHVNERELFTNQLIADLKNLNP